MGNGILILMQSYQLKFNDKHYEKIIIKIVLQQHIHS